MATVVGRGKVVRITTRYRDVTGAPTSFRVDDRAPECRFSIDGLASIVEVVPSADLKELVTRVRINDDAAPTPLLQVMPGVDADYDAGEVRWLEGVVDLEIPAGEPDSVETEVVVE